MLHSEYDLELAIVYFAAADVAITHIIYITMSSKKEIESVQWLNKPSSSFFMCGLVVYDVYLSLFISLSQRLTHMLHSVYDLERLAIVYFAAVWPLRID